MRINRLLIAGIVSIGLLTSCASNNEEPSPSQAGQVKLTLTLGTGAAISRTGGGTHASVNGSAAVPAGDGTLINSGTDEAKINTICVGLFKNDANKSTVSIQEINLKAVAVITGNSSFPNGVQQASITTTSEAYDIVIAVNVPSGKFSGVLTESDFVAKAAELVYTTSTDALSNPGGINSQKPTALPMFGSKSNINPTSATNPSVNIDLTRMVARIGIKSISTAFDKNGLYAGASFVPTGVFMHNANTSCNWDGTFTPALVSGESTTPTGSYNVPGTAPTATNGTSTPVGNEYLSTGVLAFSSPTVNTNATVNGLSVVETDYLTAAADQIYFYVFPNTNTTSPTKLVIKGTWLFNSKYEVVYYPIIINHPQAGTSFDGGTSGGTVTKGTADCVTANYKYTLSATIMGKGSNSPNTNITPATVSLNVDVNPWTATNQDVIFN